MGLDTIAEGVDRFEVYLAGLKTVIGHANRTAPLHDYCLGLLATEGRKSVEPMASTTAPAKVSAQHQKMLHFVANSPWSDARVLAKVRETVVPEIERHGPIKVWIIDDTSFPPWPCAGPCPMCRIHHHRRAPKPGNDASQMISPGLSARTSRSPIRRFVDIA